MKFLNKKNKKTPQNNKHILVAGSGAGFNGLWKVGYHQMVIRIVDRWIAQTINAIEIIFCDDLLMIKLNDFS